MYMKSDSATTRDQDSLSSTMAHSHSQSLAPLMGAPVKLGTAANGAVVNQAALDAYAKTFPPRQETVKVTDNIWVLQNTNVASAFIVGDDGVIVWETGNNLEDGKYYRAEIRKVTDKPIKAVLYSHSHEVLGTSTLLEGEKDVLIIGHPKLNANLKTSGVGAYFPETEPLQWARVYQQVNAFLPAQGPDAKWGITLELGDRGFVPVNHAVKHGEELTIAGVRFQFFTEGYTDTDDTITVWLPDQKVALNNVLWPYPPTSTHRVGPCGATRAPGAMRHVCCAICSPRYSLASQRLHSRARTRSSLTSTTTSTSAICCLTKRCGDSSRVSVPKT
jgi:hypothetical protein